MRHWSIARRLKVGLGSLAAMVLVLAVAALAATLMLRGTFDAYAQRSATTQQVNAMAEAVFEAKLAADAYRLRPGEAAAEQFRASVAEVVERRARLAEAGGATARIEAQLSEIDAEIASFAQGFEDVVTLQGETEALAEQLRGIGDGAVATLVSLMDAANRAGNAGQTFSVAKIKEDTLSGRLFMERFFLSGDAADVERASTHLGEAAQQLKWIVTLESVPERVELMRSASESIARLQEIAAQAQERFAARAAAFGEMEAASEWVLGLLGDLVDGVLSDQRVVAADAHATLRSTVAALAAGALAAIVYAGLMARATLRQVSRDFDRTLSTVSALAEGDLDVEIHGTDDRTELGEIARALVVFRDRGREAAELARQKAEADAQQVEGERRRGELRRKEDRERAQREQQAAEERKKQIFASLQDAVSGVVGAAAQGDFARRVDSAALDPEIRSLAEEINRLIANVDRGMAEIFRVSERLAEGDLRHGMEGHFEGAYAALQENFERTVEALSQIVQEIAGQAQGVRQQAAEMTEAAADLSRRAESQAASLEETSAAMTEIASSADSNARAAADTDAEASAMNEEAEQARGVLDSTVAAMRDIEEHSKEIEAIVDVIEEIAFQTNLLSLNASVEAARAGEAGKGFAVVANEVRALAQRSADASSKVQQIISQSTGAISRGSGAVDETGEALRRIVTRIDGVSGRLRGIKAASEEQATAVADVTNAFAQLDKITQRNAAVAEESRSAAALLSTQSARMEDAIARLKVRGAEASRPPGPPAEQGHGAEDAA
jgi:methyl-accepting chemotaxis protein